LEYSSTGPNNQSIPIHPQYWVVGSLTTLQVSGFEYEATEEARDRDRNREQGPGDAEVRRARGRGGRGRGKSRERPWAS
jgi:hypothetical protein